MRKQLFVALLSVAVLAGNAASLRRMQRGYPAVTAWGSSCKRRLSIRVTELGLRYPRRLARSRRTAAAGKDGVGLIVDGVHPDMDRDLAALTRIARESGVHVVASGGFYMQRNYPQDIASKSADQIVRLICS